jgi:hypothetical protein
MSKSQDKSITKKEKPEARASGFVLNSNHHHRDSKKNHR